MVLSNVRPSWSSGLLMHPRSSHPWLDLVWACLMACSIDLMHVSWRCSTDSSFHMPCGHDAFPFFSLRTGTIGLPFLPGQASPIDRYPIPFVRPFAPGFSRFEWSSRSTIDALHHVHFERAFLAFPPDLCLETRPSRLERISPASNLFFD